MINIEIDPDTTFHVIPQEDVIEHFGEKFSEDFTCPCNPTFELIKKDDGVWSVLIIHERLYSPTGEEDER